MRRFIPSTSCLIAFETAARYLSFTQAAHELHQTQGALSRQAAILEEYLGADCPNALFGPRFEQLSMVIQAAVAGLGVALMPKFLVETELRLEQLLVPFPFAVKSAQSYYLTYPEKNASKPAVIKFRDWIVSELQND